MAKPEYRHPTIEDIQVIVDLINTSNKDNPLWDVSVPEEFRKNTFEHNDWEAEGHWLALLEGSPVGYGGARVIKRRLDHGKNDGWIGFWVLPDNRGEGLENELVSRSIDYLRKRGVAEARHWDLAKTDWRLSVVEEFGFKEAKRDYIMVNKSRDVEAPGFPKRVKFEEFLLKDATDDRLEKFMQVGNDSFSEDPNFTPLTMDYLHNWKDSTQDAHRIVFGKIGNEVVGLCLSTIELEYNKLHNVNSGWIGIFGVLKEHRRKGIGKALLANAMRWIWNQGMDTIYLGVDETNPKALRVYESVGFEAEQEGVTYCLEL